MPHPGVPADRSSSVGWTLGTSLFLCLGWASPTPDLTTVHGPILGPGIGDRKSVHPRYIPCSAGLPPGVPNDWSPSLGWCPAVMRASSPAQPTPRSLISVDRDLRKAAGAEARFFFVALRPDSSRALVTKPGIPSQRRAAGGPPGLCPPPAGTPLPPVLRKVVQ